MGDPPRTIHRGTAATAALALVLHASCMRPAEPRRETPGSPRRIVSIVPAVTEMLFAMGAGPRVVAVGSFDAYPPEVLALPKVGALLDPDIERVIALRADLVVVDRGQVELQAKLGQAGIPTFPYALGDLANVTATIERLGRALGLEPSAGALASDIRRRLDEVRASAAGRPRPRTMLVFGREPGTLRNIYVSGGTGFLHDLVALAGGDNVFGDVPRESLQVSTETILARAPEVILELRYGASVVPGREVEERRSWDVLAAVPAVRAGRVRLLVGDELVVPGPRVAETAAAFARALHGAS